MDRSKLWKIDSLLNPPYNKTESKLLDFIFKEACKIEEIKNNSSNKELPQNIIKFKS